MLSNYAKTELELMVGEDEKILWQGKPNLRCFLLGKMLNPIILGFLGYILFVLYKYCQNSSLQLKDTIFLFVLLIIYIIASSVIVLFAYKKHKKISYIITDKAIYVSGGRDCACEKKSYSEIGQIYEKRSIIDMILGVGDIIFLTNNIETLCKEIFLSGRKSFVWENISIRIKNVKEYKSIYAFAKNFQVNAKSETIEPNEIETVGNSNDVQDDFALLDSVLTFLIRIDKFHANDIFLFWVSFVIFNFMQMIFFYFG